MSDVDLYKRSLLPKGFGLPVFSPQPSDDLPEAARRFGTQIGDVVVVAQDGSVDPIFNILRAADDPANRFGVPSGFEQLNLTPDDIRMRALCHPPGSIISNTSVNRKRLDIEVHIDDNIFLPVGAGAAVELSTSLKQMVVLLLPDGASSWDLRPHQIFRDYALKHGRSWYAFVNGHLRRMIGNGGLYLVTGVTKSSSWHIAAVESSSNGASLSLKLKAAMVAGASASHAWEWENVSSAVHSGPSVAPGEQSWENNQTLFIRGCKIALGSSLSKSPKVLSMITSRAIDILKTTSPPFSQPRPGTTRNSADSASDLVLSNVMEAPSPEFGLVVDAPVGDSEWDYVSEGYDIIVMDHPWIGWQGLIPDRVNKIIELMCFPLQLHFANVLMHIVALCFAIEVIKVPASFQTLSKIVVGDIIRLVVAMLQVILSIPQTMGPSELHHKHLVLLSSLITCGIVLPIGLDSILALALASLLSTNWLATAGFGTNIKILRELTEFLPIHAENLHRRSGKSFDYALSPPMVSRLLYSTEVQDEESPPGVWMVVGTRGYYMIQQFSALLT